MQIEPSEVKILLRILDLVVQKRSAVFKIVDFLFQPSPLTADNCKCNIAKSLTMIYAPYKYDTLSIQKEVQYRDAGNIRGIVKVYSFAHSGNQSAAF